MFIFAKILISKMDFVKIFSEDCWYSEWEILNLADIPNLNTYQIHKTLGFINQLVKTGKILKREENSIYYYRSTRFKNNH